MSHVTPRVHAVVGGLSVLVIGAVLGIGIDRLVLSPTTTSATPSPAGQFGMADHAAALGDLARDLRLTEAQTAHVQQVFLRHQATIDSAWNEARSRMIGVVDSATAEIETVLDPEQRARLHQWITERHGTTPHAAPGRVH